MISKLRPVDIVALVLGLALLALVLFAFMGGFQDGKADATFMGDSTAAGARIFIDGSELGTLRDQEVEGRPVPWLETRVVLGMHRLVAISAKGESLAMPYESHESGDAFICFRDSSRSGR